MNYTTVFAGITDVKNFLNFLVMGLLKCYVRGVGNIYFYLHFQEIILKLFNNFKMEV